MSEVNKKQSIRWLYWPIRLSRQPNLGQRKYEQRWGAIWGWQIGADRMSQPVFGWTIRIWRLLIKFGDKKAKMKCHYDSEYGVWIDKRLKEWIDIKERETNEDQHRNS